MALALLVQIGLKWFAKVTNNSLLAHHHLGGNHEKTRGRHRGRPVGTGAASGIPVGRQQGGGHP
jgi:hypothetical protein